MAVGILCVAAFLVRLILSQRRTALDDWDASIYLQLAENLAAGHGLRNIPDGAGHTWFQPLYPIFVAVASRVGLKLESAAYLVSSLFGSLSLIPTFLIGRRLYSARVGLLACLVMLLDYRMIEGSTSALSEMTYIFFWLWAVVGALGLVERCDRLQSHLRIGLALGVAGLVRTEGVLYFMLYLAVMLVIARWQLRRGAARALLGCALASLVFLAVLTPYLVFLYRELGYFSFTGRTKATVFAIMESPGEVYRVYPGSPVRFVLTHPGTALWRIAQNLSVITSKHIIWALHPLAMMAIACSWFVRPWNRLRAAREGVLTLVLVYPWLTFYGVTGIQTRYYLPSIALCSVWIANGIDQVHYWLSETWTQLSRRRAPSPMVVGLAGVSLLLVGSVRKVMVPLVQGQFPIGLQVAKDTSLGQAIAQVASEARPNILAVSPRIAWVAHGNYCGDLVPLSVTLSEAPVVFATVRVDYVVVDHLLIEQSYTQLAPLSNPANAPEYMNLVTRVPYRGEDGRVLEALIYHVDRTRLPLGR